ncbi:NPC intracellular cholesterol transporter 2 [Araneus ventricosus]|uniref:NPC intracellular cholesterol transporter 2 n=1 Tax=Araneus ventricosus TaxID=182803 RepID=A0A4Y2G9T3_ARAVE|nr:NPC intracellular cholesterol transporter 2 [Araneus ventricosus]
MCHRGISVVLLLVACFCITNGVYGLNITDCGSSDNVAIHEISVSYCEDVELCPLIRGNTTILTIRFEMASLVENLTAVVHGTLGDSDLFLNFPYKHRDACKEELGLKCPLMPGKIHTYKTPIEILMIYPKLKSVVKWELREERRKNLICILIPSRIVDI